MRSYTGSIWKPNSFLILDVRYEKREGQDDSGVSCLRNQKDKVAMYQTGNRFIGEHKKFRI